MSEPTTEYPAADPEIRARLLFMETLQRGRFWQALKVEVEQHGSYDSLRAWMVDNAVADQWFQEVVIRTAMEWAAAIEDKIEIQIPPSSGGVCFYYPTVHEEKFQVDIEPFAIDQEFRFVDGKAETVDQWAARLRKSFDGQLAERVSYWKALLGDDREQLARHAEWTAARFCGESYALIAKRAIASRLIADGKHRKHASDPAATVQKAVERFAKNIGLTLPKKPARKPARKS